METYGHDFAQADARVRRFRAAAAVLRRRRAVRRRSARARDPARDRQAGRHLRARARMRSCAPSTSTNAGGRMRFVAQGDGVADLPVELALAGRAQRAERARGDRRRPRSRRRAMRRSRRRSPNSRASAAASSATATSTLDGGGTFTLIDDYGHHPVEMAATLAAARESFPGRRARARVPAASLYAHARPVRGFRPRAVDRRRARARRRLSGRRGADRRGRRPRARARGTRRRHASSRCSSRRSASCRRRSATSRATATSSSRWAPARSASVPAQLSAGA